MEFNFTGVLTAKTLDEIIAMLNRHFGPVPSEIVECYKFNSCMWQARESVATFIAELHSLARHCYNGALLDEMLCNWNVYGIHDESIQTKLQSESQDH